jgi:NADH-quinone oxidoreductase subunit G
MATIYVEGVPYQVPDGKSLLDACLGLGFNIPFFCWHPALGSVGACRQCAVKQFKDENDTEGKIVMSCMTAADDGTRISIDNPEVREFRASVIEWLMTNHPHDCPVCDEGGECHLQDMTVMTGHAYRRYRFTKRTHRNQDLGPFVNHEMNRCIACYRCVRFYHDFAGGQDLTPLSSANRVYFGRRKDGVLESAFSGNLVEVCPTGVFTDKTLKQHYTRKWDLQTAPSVCVHCGLGCNTIPGERYGTLRRTRNRYNHEVNGYFLCDRGRYGYEFVNAEGRIRHPLMAGEGGKLETATAAQAVKQVSSLVGDGTIGIGSPRASLEANFALRELVGPDRFYLGVSEAEYQLVAAARQILEQGPARSARLREAETADAVLVLGEDLTNTAPMMALHVRQSLREKVIRTLAQIKIPRWEDAAVRVQTQLEKECVFVATPAPTDLDDVGWGSFRGAPDEIARLGFAVAHGLDQRAPGVADLDEELRPAVREIVAMLQDEERPMIVAGISLGSEAILRAAANVAWALCERGCKAQLAFVVPECNSMGLGLLEGKPLEAAVEAVREGTAENVIVLENDLYRRAAADQVDALLDGAKQVILLDHVRNATTEKADVVLPAATFAETSGTLVNNEGRAQRFFQVFVPGGDIRASWRWLRDMMTGSGRDDAAEWQTLDDLLAAMGEAVPKLGAVAKAAPDADFRLVGQKIPRQTHRFTGRTSIHAAVDVNEPKPPDDPDSALAFSMEGYDGQPPPALIPRYWAPGWNSVQALNKFQQEIGGHLMGQSSGARLIEPAQPTEIPFFDSVPQRFVPRHDQWLVVPLYHVFGSEELSLITPGIAELAPEPYAAIHPDDAAEIGVEEGKDIELHLGGRDYRLASRFLAELPRGVVGVPAGLPPLAGVDLPAWSDTK